MAHALVRGSRGGDEDDDGDDDDEPGGTRKQNIGTKKRKCEREKRMTRSIGM